METTFTRVAVCETCGREIQVRGGMVYQTLTRHMKEHEVAVAA